jgi:U3 small nucleolar RNA-associated protein 15
LNVRYDRFKNRLVSGGLDQHLKFFDADSFKVVYNIKTPSEIYSMDFSRDGSHYAMGLNDSSLIVRSKIALKTKEQDDEEKMFNLESSL